MRNYFSKIALVVVVSGISIIIWKSFSGATGSGRTSTDVRLIGSIAGSSVDRSLHDSAHRDGTHASRGRTLDLDQKTSTEGRPPPAGWEPLDVTTSQKFGGTYVRGEFDLPSHARLAALSTLQADGVEIVENDGVVEGSGRTPVSDAAVSGAMSIAAWSSENVGPAIPDRDSLAALTQLTQRVAHWFATNDPEKLASGAGSILPERGTVPPAFQIKAVQFVPRSQSLMPGTRADVTFTIVPDPKYPTRHAGWIRYAKKLRIGTNPPEDHAVLGAVEVEIKLPVVDGLGASSMFELTALHCFKTGGWLLCRVVVEPEQKRVSGAERKRFVVDLVRELGTAEAVYGIFSSAGTIQLRGGGLQ